MVTLTFSDELAEQLRELAAREGRSVEDVVRDMIEHYPPARNSDEDKEQEEEEAPPGSTAAFIKAALAADIHLEDDDLASRSREILDTEFPEYLRQRMNRPAIDDESE
jgi:hypothetical protein